MQIHKDLPSEPGTYVIILRLREKKRLHIGKLGEFEFPSGSYIYVGSAQGSGGLAGRLARHVNKNPNKALHWHIDYLIRSVEATQIWWEVGSPSHECAWAEKLSTIGTRIIPGFGSSDCRCGGHLIWFGENSELHWFDCIKAIHGNLEITEFSS